MDPRGCSDSFASLETPSLTWCGAVLRFSKACFARRLNPSLLRPLGFSAVSAPVFKPPSRGLYLRYAKIKDEGSSCSPPISTSFFEVRFLTNSKF